MTTDTKICTKCKVEKPDTETMFRRDNRVETVRYYSECRECECLAGQKRRKGNKAYMARTSARRRERAVEAAGRPRPDKCEICDRPPGGKGPADKALHYDHNHATGVFRGWACQDCNHCLGKMRDDPALLRRMADYLERSGPGPLPFSRWAATT